MIFWFIWYFTGGPQRSTNIKPYVQYDYEQNTIYKSDTDLQNGAKEMINLDPETEAAGAAVDTIKDNLNNPSFTK